MSDPLRTPTRPGRRPDRETAVAGDRTPPVYSLLKRLLVGRPLATSEQEHQRLPKTIALADLLLRRHLVDRLRHRGDPLRHRGGGVEPGAGAVQARPHGDRGGRPAGHRRRVLPPDDLRLPERRRLLHRQPREPRRVPVAGGRRVAARRLHPHRGGVDLGRRGRHHLPPRLPRPGRPPGRSSCLGFIVLLTLANLRGLKESGRIFAAPDLHLHRHARAPWSSSACAAPSSATSTPVPFDAEHFEGIRQAGGDPRAVPHPAGVLLRGRRPHRRRGHLQRRPRLPAPRVQERRHHPDGDGRSSSAPCSSASPSWPTTSSRTRATRRR